LLLLCFALLVGLPSFASPMKKLVFVYFILKKTTVTRTAVKVEYYSKVGGGSVLCSVYSVLSCLASLRLAMSDLLENEARPCIREGGK